MQYNAVELTFINSSVTVATVEQIVFFFFSISVHIQITMSGNVTMPNEVFRKEVHATVKNECSAKTKLFDKQTCITRGTPRKHSVLYHN